MNLTPYDTLALANRVVPMRDVLVLLGVPDADYAASGAKVDCPLGDVFHPDAGKSFRVFDNHHAYCFACSERYTVVSLYAIAKNVTIDSAAEILLDATGYRPPTAEERIEKLMTDDEVVDQHALEDALKTYCETNFSNWEDAQLDEEVARKFRQCVSLLPNVKSKSDVKEWLAATKVAMARVLKESGA